MEVERSGRGWILVEWLRHWTPRILRGSHPFVPGLPAIKHRHGRQVKRNKRCAASVSGILTCDVCQFTTLTAVTNRAIIW